MTRHHLPRFSVIVPTYNRPDALRRCIEALSRLRYPKKRFDVVVVDDGGSALLEGLVESSRNSLAARLIRQPNAGPADARNTGSRHATGEYLAFTDDDCEPEADWLTALAERFSREPDVMVGGRTVNALRDNVCAEASQTIADFVYRHYNQDPTSARFVASNNMAVPAVRLRDLGGFETSFRTAGGEDRELCRRWRRSGSRIVLEPDAVVLHAHALTLATFCRQFVEYGRGAFRFHRGAGSEGSGPLGELHFYAALPALVAERLKGEEPGRAVRLAALFGVWLMANATGYGRERLNARKSHDRGSRRTLDSG